MNNKRGARVLNSAINKKICPNSKRSQVTIFIIIAIIIVALVMLFFAFRENIFGKRIPPSIEPAYTSFLSCLEDNTLVGISILESQGGYIYLPEFEPGSRYMPFSSQLDFLGNPIPYWYYVSGNNIQKEQVPSKRDMQQQLSDFIESEIQNCVFDEYYEQGFEINQDDSKTSVSIKNNNVEVNLNMDLSIVKGEDSALIRNHKVNVNSELGSLYDSAIEVYNKEQKELFLEDYAIDNLHLYAPVDGVELTCSPKIWNAEEVFDELGKAIEINTLALRTNDRSYFSVDVSTNDEVRFINSQNWPSNFEVSPSEGSVLIAKPVGNQPGLGVLGFCYVPYHFVYNIKYPVLVQVYSEDEQEIFQFPLAVVIQGNNPREALEGIGIQAPSLELCEYRNTPVTVRTYDTNLKSVDAYIAYECFGERCEIGQTTSGIMEADFPQCVNGYVITRSEGFEDAKYLYSTTSSGSIDIVLDRLYEINVNLKLDRNNYNRDAIIAFVSTKTTKTISYPQQKTIELSEGDYEVQVYIYKDSSLKLESSIKEQCITIPRSGFGGLLGLTEEKCFDMEIPSQLISSVLAGGGKENYYILESELKSSNTLEINAKSLPLPKSLDELQDNYVLFETKGLEISFR